MEEFDTPNEALAFLHENGINEVHNGVFKISEEQ